MKGWIQQHFTIGALITALSILCSFAAYAAVLNSDVQHLKEQVLGNGDKPSLSDRLSRLEQKTDDIQESVHRIEGFITQ